MHPSCNYFDPEVLNQYKLEMAYGAERFFLLTWCLACCWPGLGANLRLIRQWKELEFEYPNEAARALASEKRFYVRGNSVPIDVEVQYRQDGLQPRIFITIPRFDEGRPVTLGSINEQGLIVPYPDYSWHDNQGYNCDGLTSVFRVAIDECNRMWVMDTGKIGDNQLCPPQLLAFDLATDQLIYRHRINASEYPAQQLYVTPVVDLRSKGPGDCRDTFVYIADVSGFGLLVVDVLRNRSWRVAHRLFYPYPSKGTFTIDGESFDLMDGVLGMALSPYHGGDRYLYFHALASTTENVAPVSVLRNDTHIENPNADPGSIKDFAGERPNQSAAEAMDRNGIMYFGLMDPPSIWCWNTATEFSPRNFHQIAKDQEALQFASGVKIVNNPNGGQELWVLTSSFQRVMTGSLSTDKINFRVHTEKISTLMANSPCSVPPKGHQPGYHANFITTRNPGQSYFRIKYRYGAV